MDPTFASPPTQSRFLGEELDFSSHGHRAHSRHSSLDDGEDGLDGHHDAFATSLSSQFSDLSGLGGHAGDLASELAGGSLASELSAELELDHDEDEEQLGRGTAGYPDHRVGDYNGREGDGDADSQGEGYRTPPRRGTRRKGGTRTPGPVATLADSLAAELDPSTPQIKQEVTPIHSPSILDTPHLDNYTSNVHEMEESLRTTRQFLDRLRGVGSSMPSSSAHASVPTATAAAAAAAAPSSSSSALNPSALGEDTTHIEQSAATLVRSLYDYANERETQIRELREMLRAFGSNDADWLAALAEVDPLDDDGQDGQGSGPAAPLGTGPVERRTVRREDEDFLGFATPLLPRPSYASDRIDEVDDDHEEDDDDDPFTSSGRSRRRRDADGPSPHSPLATHLTHLLTTTSGLITSLTTIHEHSQISKSAMNDAARRLRSIKTVMTQWRQELDGVERSRELIERELAAAADGARGAGSGASNGAGAGAAAAAAAGQRQGEVERPKDVRAWTRDQMDGFGSLLEEAERKARLLLTPVSFQVAV
ncbi:uncharacterized protein PFL1_01477 [Pseudozyma flocculosa PF-1]|uniref:Uncharacterized protein n=1 Tax=Pseudozyma flocculosa TaxID=84751 RepID=A0A5C3FBD8_9BASI|nr:uncharacterized protein PFL1_01477 [Pseudozyma flocculosa PF-1]EPQ31292.1 hypothetical protein PFL1_01477 [Pseudozyma flocculosa PF-1]SPO41753.1 uncharacterized protein PSFLO_07235 [Pseudozyma flocculosa]